MYLNYLNVKESVLPLDVYISNKSLFFYLILFNRKNVIQLSFVLISNV